MDIKAFRKVKVGVCLTGIAFILAIAGCAGSPKRNPVPPALTTKVGIPGIDEARYWGDQWPTFSKERIEKFTEDDFREYFSGIYNKPHNYLAISGGGANGAFGAGLLVGWSKSGTRPEFTMVTGISTGALTAPFAFLGSEYGDILKKVYTTTSTKDIVKKRRILPALLGDSMTDTQPLKELIAMYFGAEMIDAVAKEHKKGRRLYVGTVNLDAGRPVIWNIGAIASSDYPWKKGPPGFDGND